MKRPNLAEPGRWKDLPPAAAGLEAEIGVASRLVSESPPPDQVRLAQLAVHVRRQTQNHWSSPPRFWARAWSRLLMGRWTRAMALILLSLLVGGVATAVSGRIIQRFQSSPSVPMVKGPTPPPKGGERTRVPGQRTWRVTVDVPTELDVSVGPDGTNMAVVAGQAEISGTDIAGTLKLPSGVSWQAPSAPVAGGGLRLALRHEPRVAERTVRATPPATPPPLEPPPPPISPEPPPASAAGVPIEPPPLRLPDARPPNGVPSALPSVTLKQSSFNAVEAIGEAALVARALTRVRRQRDPLWALGDLAEHERRFPTGSLRREAALARAEALLALNRDDDALRILDSLKLEATDSDRRACLARAELRADDGRRPEAIADFDRVLASGGVDALAARALFGRAVCRVRGGDLGGARADFRAYAQRFSDGAHRADVEKMLRRLGD